jgi:surfactin synthase thioesterase subunit
VLAETHERYWVRARRAAGARPALRLFCFPHAGAGGAIFLDWARLLPEWIELVGVQLPGRGQRARETPLDSVGALVAELARALEGQRDLPWLFFGHSFGAALAYELALALRARGDERLRGLVVSGCPAPHLALKRDVLLHELPRERFLAELARLDGIPAEALTDRKLQELIEPPLRADVKARELWTRDTVARGRPAEAPLALPLQALGGAADGFVSRAALEAWAAYTSAPREVLLFEGGHFYFQHAPERVTAVLAGIAAELAEPAR